LGEGGEVFGSNHVTATNQPCGECPLSAEPGDVLLVQAQLIGGLFDREQFGVHVTSVTGDEGNVNPICENLITGLGTRYFWSAEA
jgi:hypothetical protein